MAGLLDWITGAVKQQYAQGAPYREAIGGLLQGDPTKFGLLAQEFNRKAQTPEGALDVALNFAPFGITAFHGSPASFEKFDLSKVGTGTGIQNYGHGFYFTESPEVAKQYAKQDSMLYKVDIKDKILPSMVEWEKPFSKQPKVVQDAFKKLQKEDPYLPIKGLIKDDAVGGALMQTLPLEQTNQMLSKYGVTGVKYADKTAKAQNYVVFDPEMIKILERKKGLLENSKTPFEIAHMTAQRNAALPVSEGGLGLPANNTAMDRAKAMGFDVDNMWFRGDKPNLSEFNPNDPSNYIKGNIFLTDKKNIASWYAKTGKQKDIMNMPSNESEGVYSLFTKNNPKELKIEANQSSWVDIPVPKAWKKSFYDGTGQIDDVALMANQKKYPSMQVNNVVDQYGLGNQKVIFNPSDIRSVNAAFDPFRRNEADILAGLLAVPATQLMNPEEKKKKRNTK